MPARALVRDGEKEGGVMMRTRVVVDPPFFRPRPWRVVSDQTSRGAGIVSRQTTHCVKVQLVRSEASLGESIEYLVEKMGPPGMASV